MSVCLWILACLLLHSYVCVSLCVCNIEESRRAGWFEEEGMIDQYHHLDDKHTAGIGERGGRQLNRTPLCLISSFKMAAMVSLVLFFFIWFYYYFFFWGLSVHFLSFFFAGLVADDSGRFSDVVIISAIEPDCLSRCNPIKSDVSNL